MPSERNRILKDSPFPWWEWDVTANSVEFSALKATMLGYEPGEFAGRGYQAFTELLHPDDYPGAMAAMRSLLSGATDLYQVDYRIRSKDGDYKWYMDRGTVSEFSGGRILKIRGIVIDLGREKPEGASVESLVRLISGSIYHRDGKTESVLTICSNCRKAKVSGAEWVEISAELEKTIGERLSHGICPECVRSLYPDYFEPVLQALEKRNQRL